MSVDDDPARYARQVVLPEIGVAGQERLKRARVLVIGAGGLGSPAALYLAAAGVGQLGILDDDVVEASNLHRQILHGSSDVGSAKTESATRALARLNPGVAVRAHRVRFTAASADAVISDYDVVVDGSDNYTTRYAVNDACARLGRPWVYGSVERFAGQVAVFGLPNGPCYRCLFAEAPAPGSTPNCEEIGVLGAVPGVIGSLQAVEALKLVLGIGQPLSGRLLQVDLLTGTFRAIKVDKRSSCAACGNARENTLRHMDTDALPPSEITPADARAALSGATPPMLLDVREPWEVQRATIAGAVSIPLRELQRRVGELDHSRELIVYCHHGGRSRAATEWLRSQGVRASNLTGGIDRWSAEVDPAVPRY